MLINLSSQTAYFLHKHTKLNLYVYVICTYGIVMSLYLCLLRADHMYI